MSNCKQQSPPKRRPIWQQGLAIFLCLLVLNLNPVLAKAQPPAAITVSGTVTDTVGSVPMSGVTVTEKGTNNATVTAADGAFQITVKDEAAVLLFSYVGYRPREITVGTQSILTVQLVATSSQMDEVIVVGFGTQKKQYLTGSITQIDAKVLENRPVNNIGQALQGVAPNLNVSISSGAPNTMPSINIRGGTSFSKNSSGNMVVQNGSPYILVDGVEMDINLLNPDDIQSISVLSDAASSAIYGARGAYGVVLVTTKKGKRGERANLSYSNMFQWNRPSGIPDLLSAIEIQQAAVDAFALIGQGVPPEQQALLDSIIAYENDPVGRNPYYMDGNLIRWVANINPYELAVKDWSPSQKHNLSLSGGSGKTTYYASAGYFGQEGMYRLNTDKFKRYNFMLNTSTTVSDWFKVDLKTNYNRSVYTQPVNPAGKGGWWIALAQEPGRNVNMPLRTPANAPVPNAYTDNILSFMDYYSLDKDDKDALLLTVSPTFTPVKNWNIKADFSYRSENYKTKTLVPYMERINTNWNTFATEYTNPSSIYKSVTDVNHFVTNIYSDYSLKLTDHNLYGLVGYNQELNQTNNLWDSKTNLITADVPTIGQATGQLTGGDSEREWAVKGVFYRVTYDYKGKYLLGSNGRYDGSSRFATESRFKMFPTVSAGWLISKEKFFEPLKSVVSDLKFRGSYGSLGNQNVNTDLWLRLYGTTAQVNYLFGGIRPLGINPPSLIDPNLTWETATTLDLGFDATLFKRLNINFSWYDRKTTNILVDGEKFPAVLGAASPTTNSGILDTKGFDFQANYKNTTRGGLNYDITATLSNYKTVVVSFKNNPNKLLSTLYDGQVVGDIWGYDTYGIFQDEDEIANAPLHTGSRAPHSGIIYPGDIRFKDLDGNDSIYAGTTVLNPGDLKVLGNTTPKYAFSLNTFLSWRAFDCNIFIQGIGKRDYYIGDRLYWGIINGGGGTREVYSDSWTPDNRNAEFPAYRNRSSNVTTQSRFLQNAAYARLKNLSLGYTLPAAIAKKVAMQKLRVSASAYNILTISSVPKYYDPEVLSPNYPMLKSVAVGIQATF
ncbi:TonB-dependent receptor [Niabella insulamsoli]|uniref:SusC/RagA family TonB-linked outer membrane protein n=1 Tax=Niabella insulamsoli TaxID=3144874 RepID=UPI0031FD7E2D